MNPFFEIYDKSKLKPQTLTKSRKFYIFDDGNITFNAKIWTWILKLEILRVKCWQYCYNYGEVRFFLTIDQLEASLLFCLSLSSARMEHRTFWIPTAMLQLLGPKQLQFIIDENLESNSSPNPIPKPRA